LVELEQGSDPVKIVLRIMPFLLLSFVILIGNIREIRDEFEEEFSFDMEDEEDEEVHIKVAVVEDKAYWVFGNVLYEAKITEDEIMKEEAKPVNAFDMKLKDVNKMMTVLDSISDWEE
jgi:hypothetical protein